MAGQEGFEPPTIGFGIRRSTVGATALRAIVFELSFFMHRMLFKAWAIFFKLNFISCFFAVFSGSIVDITTLRTF